MKSVFALLTPRAGKAAAAFVAKARSSIATLCDPSVARTLGLATSNNATTRGDGGVLSPFKRYESDKGLTGATHVSRMLGVFVLGSLGGAGVSTPFIVKGSLNPEAVRKALPIASRGQGKDNAATWAVVVRLRVFGAKSWDNAPPSGTVKAGTTLLEGVRIAVLRLAGLKARSAPEAAPYVVVVTKQVFGTEIGLTDHPLPHIKR